MEAFNLKDEWKSAWNQEVLSPNTTFNESDVVLAIDPTINNENN